MAIQGKPGGAITKVLPNPLATRPLASAKPTQLLPEAKKANEDQVQARDLIRQFNETEAARRATQAQQAEQQRAQAQAQAQRAQQQQQKKDLQQAQQGLRFAAQHTPEQEKPRFLDRWAGRLQRIPDPGSILFPLLLILLMLFFILRYGPKNLTRAELTWGVLVEDLQIQSGSVGSGVSGSSGTIGSGFGTP